MSTDAQAGRLVAHTLTSAGHDATGDGTGRGTPIVSGFHMIQDPIDEPDGTPAFGRNSGGMGVATGASVRRLTPRECERIQGFPDDWTIGPDSRRYAALGDAVTVNVTEWIGRRIMDAEKRMA